MSRRERDRKILEGWEDPYYYEEYCFKCCTEYGTNEPCPDCDCSFLDVFEEDEFWEDEEEV